MPHFVFFWMSWRFISLLFMADIANMREYCKELVVAIFLIALDPEISAQIRGQIIGTDSVPLLSSTFSHVLRISIATPAPVSYQSAM